LFSFAFAFALVQLVVPTHLLQPLAQLFPAALQAAQANAEIIFLRCLWLSYTGFSSGVPRCNGENALQNHIALCDA
jgi:hypothetical protein